MFQSKGLRFIAVGLLAFLMFVPLGLVSDIVEERSRYSERTVADISREWGGAQRLGGPVLIIPVTEDVTYDRRREAVDAVTGLSLRDDDGKPVYEHFQETVTEARAPVFLAPERLDIEVRTESQVRRRGIFEVPVYTAQATLGFDFDTDRVPGALRGEEAVHWEQARLELYLASNRALRGEAEVSGARGPLALEPVAGPPEGRGGVAAATGDPRGLGALEMRLTMNGAQSLTASAGARRTALTISGDWPDPGFGGSFLPDRSEIGPEGFTASWTVPHLARALPLVSRENLAHAAGDRASMAVSFVTPNDFYQKAWRSARYGILFIGLTFLTILLIEGSSARPAHPVQYLMVGLAQSVFVLLMVAYAEQVGFGMAYAIAAGATIGLLVVFGATALRLGRRTWLLGGVLTSVYAVLYLILQSAEFALLAGSTLAFIALAGTMIGTRNEDWHGPERTGPRWFRRKAEAVPPAG